MDSASVISVLKHNLDNPEKHSASEVNTRPFWVQAQAAYKKASSEEKSAILEVLRRWIVSSTSSLTTPGLELLIPVIWESLVLSQDCVDCAPLAFHLLSLIIRSDHPNLQFADTLAPMLTTSLQFIWTHPLDGTVDLDFVGSLIDHSRKQAISLDFAISSILSTWVQSFSDQMLDQDGEHIWKRLLLVARLIDALDPMVSVQALPSWSSTLATFTLHCLQIKGLIYHASCRYVIYELLASLSRYAHNSLKWLRPLCTPANNAQPLVVLLTSVCIELQLELNQITEGHSGEQQPPDVTALAVQAPHNSEKQPGKWQFLFAPATPLLNQVTMKNVSELLRLGLVDMKDANSVAEPGVAKSTALFSLLTDDSANGLWCQLMDLSGAIRAYFRSTFSPHGVDSSSSARIQSCTFKTVNMSVMEAQPDEVRQQNAYLLSAYLAWLEVYYEVHHDEIVSESNGDIRTLSRRLGGLWAQLVEIGLHRVGPCLWSLLCSYFLRLEFSPHSATERCLASLDFLSGLIPGRPIIPYAMFTERGPVSLGGVISNWLWSVWNDPDPSDAFKEAMLHVLVVTNNAWLSGVADPWEWETHFDLIHWSANPASFPNRTIKAGLFQSQFIDSEIRLDLNVEVTMVCMYTAAPRSLGTTTTAHQSTEVGEEWNNYFAALIASTKQLLRELRQSVNENGKSYSESSGFGFKALEKRLNTGIQQCATIQPIFRQLCDPVARCTD